MIAERSTLLGLDTAGASCSVAIMRDGEVLANRLEEMRRGQSERLLPIVQNVLDETGLELLDIDGFVTTIGPGGFTGVRIGLAAAQGFSLACNKPLVGVTNFEALARAVPEEERIPGQIITVMIDAKRADIFIQCFDEKLQPLTGPFAAAPDQIDAQLPSGTLLLVGDGVDQAEETLRQSDRCIVISKTRPKVDAKYLLAKAHEENLFSQLKVRLKPLYLRAPDVSLPKKKQITP